MLDDRFDIIEQIARTPTSEVVKAFDRSREKVVAIKTVDKSRARPIELLRREFETLTYLDHPNIVRVYDFGEEQDFIYYTMDYYAGWRFDQAGPDINLPYLFDFSLQLLSALDYVHRRGIIHGDVKPGNVFEAKAEDRRRFILGDFGLVRQVEGEDRYPVSGTMEYIAPEVFQGVMDDPRSDLYSFGILFFRVITSRLPFMPGDDISRVKRKPRYDYVRLREVAPDVYPELDVFASRLVQHNPADRFASAYEAITKLAELARAQDIPLPETMRIETDLATGRFFGYEKEVTDVFRPSGDNQGPEVFIVEGSAGVGKTAFLREVGRVAQLKRGSFLYVDCGAGEGVLRALRRVLGVRVRAAFPEAYDGTGISRSLEAALMGAPAYDVAGEADVLRSLNDSSGKYDVTVLALDNVDAEDGGTAKSVTRLVNYPFRGRVKFVIALARPGGAFTKKILAGPQGLLTVKKFELKGFSEETTERYLEYALGVPKVDPALSRHVKRLARGNPGVLRRTIEHLIAEKTVIRRLDGWHVDYGSLKTATVCPAPDDYLVGVIERLGENEKESLALAAAYGYYFPGELVKDGGVLGRLVEAGVISKEETPDAGYSFANAAVREYVLEWAREEYLEEASAGVVAFLDRNGVRDVDSLEAKGRAYLRMGSSRKARGPLLEAGRAAARTNDFERAVELLEAALTTEGNWYSEAYEDAVTDLAEAYSAMGDHASALGYYDALVRCRKPGQVGYGKALLQLSRERLVLGDFEAPARDLDGLPPDELEAGDRFLRQALLAWTYFRNRDFDRAITLARDAEALAAAVDRPDLVAYVNYVKGAISYYAGDADAALAAFAETARLAEEAGKPRLASIALNLTGEVLLWRADVERAEDATRRSIELAKRAHDRYALVASLIRLARIYHNQGYVKRAAREFEAAEAECKLIDNPELLASIYVGSAANMIRAGEYRRAEFYLDELDAEESLAGAIPGYASYYRALIAAENGELDEALEHLKRSEESFTERGARTEVDDTRSLRGRVLFLAGRYEEAEEELARCLKNLEDSGDKLEHAKVLLTRGELSGARGDADLGEAYLDQALSTFTALSSKYFLGRCYMARAELKLKALRGAGDVDIIRQARNDLEKAKTLFGEIGVNKYRVKIFELEGNLFMAERNSDEGEKKLAELADGLKELSDQPDLDDLLKFILSYLAERLEADRGVIFLLDEHNNVLRIKGTAGVDDSTIEDASVISKTIIGHVAESKKAVFSPNAAEDFRFKDSASVQLHGIRSLICIPLAGGDGAFQGVVYLDSLQRESLFAEEDLNFAQVFARAAAYEIERRRRRSEESFATISIAPREEAAKPLLVGSSQVMEELRGAVASAAQANVDVLVVGESGTGKELVVRTVHTLSPNADAPFIGVNCAAIPEALLESELFGIEKGTATGVDKRIGLFERAGDGTIFLDEVAAMDMNTQSKLLRVLQEKRFVRLGSRTHQTIPLKARVVSATNADLPEAIASGKFREDLFYRLNVFLIGCPPLREHREDIPELLNHFVTTYYQGKAKDRPRFSPEAVAIMTAYEWPGNVRELENCVRYALTATSSRVIEPDALPVNLRKMGRPGRSTSSSSLNESLANLEREMILEALEEARWVKAAAARKLEISETNLRYKMKKYGISPEEKFPIE
ncbi:MAG: sigma 54-interacting transcriptional regulator [Candidatus Zixiibacteriota bacterium]|jgi:Nif-specific regulatory protein